MVITKKKVITKQEPAPKKLHIKSNSPTHWPAIHEDESVEIHRPPALP